MFDPLEVARYRRKLHTDPDWLYNSLEHLLNCAALGWRVPRRDVSLLMRLARHPERGVMRMALELLGYVCDEAKEQVRPFLEEALDFVPTVLRGSPLQSLAQLGDPRSLPAMIASMRDMRGSHWDVVQGYVFALTAFTHPLAEQALLQCWQDFNDTANRAEIMTALMVMNTPATSALLEEIARGKWGKDYMPRAAAYLIHLQHPHAAECMAQVLAQRSTASEPELLFLLQDSDPESAALLSAVRT